MQKTATDFAPIIFAKAIFMSSHRWPIQFFGSISYYVLFAKLSIIWCFITKRWNYQKKKRNVLLNCTKVSVASFWCDIDSIIRLIGSKDDAFYSCNISSINAIQHILVDFKSKNKFFSTEFSNNQRLWAKANEIQTWLQLSGKECVRTWFQPS